MRSRAHGKKGQSSPCLLTCSHVISRVTCLNYVISVSHEAESFAQRECDVITARPIAQKTLRASASVHRRPTKLGSVLLRRTQKALRCVVVWSKHHRSLLRNLRQSSESVQKMFGNVCQAFGTILKNLRKSSESGRKSLENRQKRRY